MGCGYVVWWWWRTLFEHWLPSSTFDWLECWTKNIAIVGKKSEIKRFIILKSKEFLLSESIWMISFVLRWIQSAWVSLVHLESRLVNSIRFVSVWIKSARAVSSSRWVDSMPRIGLIHLGLVKFRSRRGNSISFVSGWVKLTRVALV